MASLAEGTYLSLTRVTSFPVIAITVAVGLVYLLYQWLLPKPLPGIPYNAEAAKSILGNFPEVREYIKKHKRLRPWLMSQTAKLNSPIVQFWMLPFTRPMVVVSDFQEAQDILVRRSKEFDRGQRSVDIFAGAAGDHHIAMVSADPRFKGNKELVRDLMSPKFLNEVCPDGWPYDQEYLLEQQ
jgi:hypothetical protein